jgi:hypothetical protein
MGCHLEWYIILVWPLREGWQRYIKKNIGNTYISLFCKKMAFLDL